MPDVYRRVMTTTAVLAAMTTTGYLVATAATLSDGIGVGLEMPRAINSMCAVAVCASTTIAACAWFARRGHMRAAEVHIRPLVREELDKALADTMPLLVATIAEAADRRAAGVAEAVAEAIDSRLRGAATAAAQRTAALIREQHTADLTEICELLHRKTLIAGMGLQAKAAGEQIAKTALHSVKSYVSTSTGD